MNDIIYVEMHAYNAEKTIARAIESVLNQTYGNLVLHVLDNASTDSTLDIIMQYAEKDARVVPYHFAQNYTTRWTDSVTTMLFSRKHLETAWYASLSADDEYDVTCFEKLLNFALENNLDIAACRSRFIGDVDGRNYNKNIDLENNLIIQGDDFGSQFPDYWRYFRANWGHIVKISGPIEFTTDKNIRAEYGEDNRFMLKVLKSAHKIGVLNDTLHKYYIHKNALSVSYTGNRYRASSGLVRLLYDYLEQKVGYVSKQNEQFIYQSIYLRHLMNSFPVICRANIPEEQKLYELYDMIMNDTAQKLLNKGTIPHNEKSNCFKFVYDFLLHCQYKDAKVENCRKQIIDILGPLL